MKIGVVAKNASVMEEAVLKLKTIADKYDVMLIYLKGNYDDEQALSEKEFFKEADIIVSLGGDGTILRIAGKAAENDICIFGINFGRVGFLTDIEKDEVELFEKVLKNEYIIEERMMIKAEVTKDDKLIKKLDALNEVVISRGMSPKMIETQVYVDNQLTDTYRADGIIIATPTGSTAYSLSAGGSVIDPKSRLMEITPICSHTLKSRPLIVGEDRRITVKHIHSEEDEETYISSDGDTLVSLSGEYDVNIAVSDKKVKLIRVKNRNFYSVLKEKL